MATPALRLVDTPVVTVEVPVGLLANAIDNAASIADDLEAGVDVVAQRIFAGNRAAALHELGALHIRIESLRADFAAISPEPTHPSRPHRVV